jgi:DNA-binding FadR family transcriptional regulator
MTREAFTEADLTFHRAMFAAADNDLLLTHSAGEGLRGLTLRRRGHGHRS